MGSYDITFCSKINCVNKKCPRRIVKENIQVPYISMANFTDCKYFDKEEKKNDDV